MTTFPEILKCGSLILGSSSFIPEKNPVILSMIPFTAFFAASTGFIIASLIPFHTEVAVLLIPLKIE